MSGQQNQPPRGWNRGPSSPIYHQQPLPWARASPPPIISGPRTHHQSTPFNNVNNNYTNHTNNSYGSPKSPAFGAASGRSTPMSPMFGTSSAMRGTRGPQVTYPQPRWPGSPPPMSHAHHQSPIPMHSRVSSSPIPVGMNGSKTYRTPFSPVPMYANPTPVYGTPPEYLYSAPPVEFEMQPRYEYVGVPLEPPQPKSYVIYDDDEDHGPSTAEIIANQSQDYVDEKLAEYQLTIAQLQGE